MRKLLSAAVFVLAIPTSGVAAPVCVAGALSDYIALAGGCEIGGATVSHFTSSVLLLGATEILPDEVSVSPIQGVSSVALDFSFDQGADPGELFDILIRYDLSGPPSDLNTLSMIGSAATLDGVVTAVEDKCVGGVYAGADPGTACAGDPLTSIVVQDSIGLISPDAVMSFARRWSSPRR